MIRLANENDLERIVTIYNQSIPGRQATADTQEVSVSSRREWFAAHDERHPLWVFERDGLILGWASLQPFYGRPAYAATKEVSVYVADGAQGQGIGTSLLHGAIQGAREHATRTLLGFIFSHNLPSLALFERHGFVHWGQLPDIAELDQERVSLTILGRHLDEEPQDASA